MNTLPVELQDIIYKYNTQLKNCDVLEELKEVFVDFTYVCSYCIEEKCSALPKHYCCDVVCDCMICPECYGEEIRMEYANELIDEIYENEMNQPNRSGILCGNCVRMSISEDEYESELDRYYEDMENAIGYYSFYGDY